MANWLSDMDSNHNFDRFLRCSWLPFFAYLCADLYVKIQAFTSYCKHYFAFIGNNRQENLCGLVRAVRKLCADYCRPESVRDCAGGFLSPERSKRAVGAPGLASPVFGAVLRLNPCRGLAGARGRVELAMVCFFSMRASLRSSDMSAA